MRLVIPTFCIIAVLNCFRAGQGEYTYYVKPTAGHPCTQQPCATLSQYTESSYLFQRDNRNITMKFLPGVHNISKALIISNVHSLILQGPNKVPANCFAHIKCSAQVHFNFSHIHTLEINNLCISHCGTQPQNVMSQQQPLLVTANNIPLVIFARRIHTLHITNSTFFENWYGSVIYAIQTNNIIVINSIFDRNSASYFTGGGITVLLADNLAISNSTFSNNNCSRGGGAMYLDRISSIVIINSKFMNNSAHVFHCKTPIGCSNGGGITVFGYGHNAYFNPTRVTKVVFDGQTVFENNFAQGMGGGIVIVDVTFVHFSGKTVFYNNSAYLAQGGALRVENVLKTTISMSSFRKNRAVYYGGAASLFNIAIISIINCTFIENYATVENKLRLDGGGGGLAVNRITDNVYRFSLNIMANNKCIEDIKVPGYQYGNLATANNVNDITDVCTVDKMILVFKGITTFTSNFVEGEGGGLFVQRSAILFLGKTYLKDNYAAASGGGMLLAVCEVLFYDEVHIEHNVGNVRAGGIASKTSSIIFKGKTTKFLNNSGNYFGGGLFAVNSHINFTGKEITFESNQADRRDGGGIGISGTKLTMTADRIIFKNNTGVRGGAILTIQTFQSIKLNEVIINSTGTILFVHNHASQVGGALCLFDNNLLLSGDIRVLNNSAIMKGGWLHSYGGTVTIKGKINAEHNSATKGGVISGKDVTIFLQADEIMFESNVARSGGSIFIESSDLHMLSNSSFERNYAERGGAFSLITSSRIYLYQNTYIILSYNSAVFEGGAIYVDDYSYVGIRDLSIVQCFIQSTEIELYQAVKNSSMKQLLFYNNSAENGQDLFGGLLDRCNLDGDVSVFSVHDQKRVYTYYNGKLLWFLLSNSSSNNNKSVSSYPLRVCLCTHDFHNCTYKLPTLSKFRGQTIKFSAVVVDQVETPLSSVIRAQFPKHSKGELGEGEYLHTLPAQCSPLTFHVFSPNENETLEIYSDDGPCRDLGISKLNVTVNLLPCPLGFQPSKQNRRCICNRLLQQFTNSCDINTLSIHREGNYWFSYDNKTFVFHRHCPFDYCKQGAQSITLEQIDRQCAYNRSGILCGSCKANLSLSFGSSQCQPCQPFSFVWLTLLFAIAGILLVIFLLLFHFTVAVGTINGLIFYANVVAVNKALLFPLGKIKPLLIFIAWLNLDLGIETCYYNGMDTYGRTWLQFLFPLYLWVLVALIIFVSHYSTYAAKLFGRNPVSVLATLFLLSYTKLLRTIITVFSVSFIEYPEKNTSKAIWLYDGNINYLQGKHIPLFIAALLFLVIIFLPYTLLLTFGQCLRRVHTNKGFGWTRSMFYISVMDAYHAPYKNKHRYWTGLMLLVRCGLFLIFSFNVLGDSSINFIAIIIVMIFVISLVMYLKIYRNKVCNFIEFLFMVNLVILAAATQQLQFSPNKDKQEIVSSLSVSISFLIFTAILIYHSYKQLKDTVCSKIHRFRAKRKKQVTEQEITSVENECHQHELTSTVVDIKELKQQYSEPLLESEESNI